MIEIQSDSLKFSFPAVHPEAVLSIDFQRTLRIPDDNNTYPLPPGLGRFPLKNIDDYQVPASWVEHGGVMLPMYQSEALWINFNPSFIAERGTAYPFAIKIAAGKINAVSGQPWTNPLSGNPQDYMVSTKQPWLDGYSVAKGIIRQFVAMPLGTGYSAEEQLTGKAEHGGIQVIVYPMKAEVFEKRFPLRRVEADYELQESDMLFSAKSSDMGLAPGGKMKQDIYKDPFKLSDWDQSAGSRCFVHIANSLVWRAITGEQPPTTPLTAKEYNEYGYPWFDYYDDQAEALGGSNILAELKSIIQKAKEKMDNPLPENETVTPGEVKVLKDVRKVREGRF
jgi:hypothetical protein